MSTSQRRQCVDIYSNISAGSASLTPSAVTAGTTGTSTVTVPGCLIGDIVEVAGPASFGSLGVDGEVQAAGVVTIKFANATAGSLTPPSGVYVCVCKTLDPKMAL